MYFQVLLITKGHKLYYKYIVFFNKINLVYVNTLFPFIILWSFSNISEFSSIFFLQIFFVKIFIDISQYFCKIQLSLFL